MHFVHSQVSLKQVAVLTITSALPGLTPHTPGSGHVGLGGTILHASASGGLGRAAARAGEPSCLRGCALKCTGQFHLAGAGAVPVLLHP